VRRLKDALDDGLSQNVSMFCRPLTGVPRSSRTTARPTPQGWSWNSTRTKTRAKTAESEVVAERNARACGPHDVGPLLIESKNSLPFYTTEREISITEIASLPAGRVWDFPEILDSFNFLLAALAVATDVLSDPIPALFRYSDDIDSSSPHDAHSCLAKSLLGVWSMEEKDNEPSTHVDSLVVVRLIAVLLATSGRAFAPVSVLWAVARLRAVSQIC